MMSRVRKFIQKCSSCQINKSGRRTKIPMRITTTSTVPFEKLFLDIVGPLVPTHEGNKVILTMQDDLTKYSLAVPLKSQETYEVAKAFTENFVCKYGIPRIIVTDQGSNFMSLMFKDLCKLLGIKKLNTSAYHPQSNGALEKSHLNLAQYLRNYISDDPLNWDQWVPYAMFTYNSTPHCVTEYMPFELLFGYVPTIPNSLKKEPEPLYNFSDYSLELKNRLQISWKVARENIIKSKEKSKKYYDKSSSPATFNVGDKVLMTNESKSKTKFDPPWFGPFEVIKINSPENSQIKINRQMKTVHNNRLKHFVE